MSARYYGVPTNIGAAAIANAALLGVKLDIKTFVVGDGGGSYYEPKPDMTALRRETWRGNIALCEIDEKSPNVINVGAYIPSDVGGFTAREIGTLDGKGKLIGVANIPDTQIVKFEDGVTDESMFILSFAVTNSEVFEWYADPTVIIASKADIEKHNKNASAHQDIRDLISASFENIPKPTIIIEIPELGQRNAQLQFKLINTGRRWRSPEPDSAEGESEPVSGVLMLEDGNVTKGSLELEDGTIADLTIIPEISGN